MIIRGSRNCVKVHVNALVPVRVSPQIFLDVNVVMSRCRYTTYDNMSCAMIAISKKFGIKNLSPCYHLNSLVYYR